MPYRSQFRWAVIEDRTKTTTTATGSELTTNHGASGGEDREVRGPVSLEHTFAAPFARTEPWHDAPAVSELTPADRAASLALIGQRAALFQPDFAAAYRFLASLPTDRGVSLDLPQIRRQACLEAGYAVGIRVATPLESDLRLLTTGTPVVVARGVGEALFRLPELPGVAERYAAMPNDMGFCFAVSFAQLFPGRLLLVKGAEGQWRILP